MAAAARTRTARPSGLRSRTDADKGTPVSARSTAFFVVVVALGCSMIRIGEPEAVDVNRSDAAALVKLPGLGPADAERIVAGRPYAAKEDLLRRHILDAHQYDAVERYVFVGPPGMPDYLRDVPPLPQGP
jgi:DNA uptake protein ComE-like DNA-binding protein